LRAEWGHGYASEAAHAALDRGFAGLGLGEIVAVTVPSTRTCPRGRSSFACSIGAASLRLRSEGVTD
jgi:GNAT acetyltransferase-like protein